VQSETADDSLWAMAQALDQSFVPSKPRSIVVRSIYLVLGLICLGFAFLSWLPGIPTFDFVVLAAFFFARSSDRLHDWMLNHKWFGKIINGYRDNGLTTRMKWVAVAAITLSLGFSAVFLIDGQILRTTLILVYIYAIWFVFSRPTRQPVAQT
jgi:uncharacterized membrane protein YbaN (DUF454 family)